LNITLKPQLNQLIIGLADDYLESFGQQKDYLAKRLHILQQD